MYEDGRRLLDCTCTVNNCKTPLQNIEDNQQNDALLLRDSTSKAPQAADARHPSVTHAHVCVFIKFL